MANCAVCREDIRSGNECPRCGNKDQGSGDLTYGYFGSIWAILSFLLILAPLFMLLPAVMSRLQIAFSSIASVRVAAPIALLLTMVFAFFLFSMRDDLHLEHQSRTFREKQRIPLPMRALLYFVAAVVMTFFLGFVVTTKGLLIGPGRGQIAEGSIGHLLFQFVMTGCLVLVFAFFALAAGHMAVYEFGLYAEQHTPDPIFLDEQLMLSVVLKAVRKHIGNIGRPLDKDNRPIDARQGDEVQLFLGKMQRTSNAGITLQLYQKGVLEPVVKDKDQGEDKEKKKNKERLIEEKGWLVEADLWARLTKVVEHGKRAIKVEELPERKPESGTGQESENKSRSGQTQES